MFAFASGAQCTEVKLQAEGPRPRPTLRRKSVQEHGRLPMVKGDQGVWEIVIGPIEPGIYAIRSQ